MGGTNGCVAASVKTHVATWPKAIPPGATHRWTSRLATWRLAAASRFPAGNPRMISAR